jgi:tetratricopeptide (TPR) repeat protein
MRLLAGLLLLLLVSEAHAQVKVWEGHLSLATSDEGLPDENPPFDIYAKDRFNYPYTLREDVHRTESVQAWRAVFLENDYLKCTVLPDLGGHVYTCIDKINGQPMFYANPTLKKALIGYRGAWAAFGIEFNFPVSHNWASLSPVDYAYSSAPDGSASITVGNRDRVYGMQWTVQLTLHPGSTVLEERVTLSNPSDVRHRFYWWNNAGVQVWDDSKIWYPMPFTASHGFTNIDTWPVNSKGMDLSLIANHKDGPVSRFVYGSRESFMGIYNPHTDAGVVHYAAYEDLPAKKIWTWGTDADGLAWRNVLSDNDSAYAEVQAGLFRNQETYGFLEPQQVIRFSEYWMPARHLGGISRANLNGVVWMNRTPGADGRTALTTAFNANSDIPSARIQILDGNKTVFEEHTSLNPTKAWSHQFNDLPSDRKYTFVIEDGTHQVLLKHTEGEYDWTPRDQVHVGPQSTPAPSTDPHNTSDVLERGRNDELQGNLIAAWNDYTEGLAATPASFDLMKAQGRLDVNLLRFEEASKLLKNVEDRATWDAETRYYRGIAEEELGHHSEARIEFEAAYRNPSFRTAGGLLLAELLASEHDVSGALSVLAKACPDVADSFSTQRCVEDTVALERASGQRDVARQLASASLANYPTSALLKNELSILGAPIQGLDQHLAADPNRILDLVIQYNRLGLYADSLALLSRNYPQVSVLESEPATVSPDKNPLIAYYRGYCREQLGQSGKSDFEAASKMSLRFIFPSQADTIPVLHAALAANASDASAHFLLATLWFSKGIVDPAIEGWQRAASLRPDIPTLDANLGRALLDIKHEPAEAARIFERGFSSDPSNPALYVGMDRAMQQLGKSPAERVAMFERFPAHADMPAEFVRAFVDAYQQNGQPDKADALLAAHFLPRKEGAAPLLPPTATKASKS